MKIGIIGAGNMGEALLKGLLPDFRAGIIVSDASAVRREYLQKKYKIRVSVSNAEVASRSDILLLAVKPQVMDVVISEIAALVNEKKLVISIAAGIKTRAIEKGFAGRKAPVIRVMPNLPVLVGRGISAICAGRFVKDNDKRMAVRIFSNVGEVVEVKEEMMDAVTAISGSGPAYFFYLMEMLIKAGVKEGLDRRIVEKLAVRTALGSAELISKTGQAPDAMRHKVTSRGGATEAAFKVFKRFHIGNIFYKAVKAAARRSRELSRGKKCL